MNTEQECAELLPCPFCGSTNIEIQISTPDREGVPTNLMCSDCGASGPWEYEQDNSHAKADAAWNTRAALQSQDKEDAERYRWLRLQRSITDHACVTWNIGHDWVQMDGAELDAAIDRARRAEVGGTPTPQNPDRRGLVGGRGAPDDVPRVARR